MRENVKVEVALEIITMKIGIESNRGNTKKVNDLIDLRKQIYDGNFEKVGEILDILGSEIKNDL